MHTDVLMSETLQELAPEEVVVSLADIGPRIVIGNVSPEIDGGKYPAKAVLGDVFSVECDVLTDGHEQTAVALRYREPDADEWREAPMRPLGNDRWQGEIRLEQRGIYDYTIVAWRDAVATWLAQARAKQAAGQKLDVEFQVASGLLKAIADDGAPEHRQRLHKLRSKFEAAGVDEASAAQRLDLIAASATQTLLRAAAPRPFMQTYDRQLSVLVERKARGVQRLVRADAALAGERRHAPRHLQGRDRPPALRARHGLRRPLSDADPSHRAHQSQGPQQQLSSPRRAIPAAPTPSAPRRAATTPSIPSLAISTISRSWSQAAAEHGLEIALDFAIQCSPDHPWIKEHPEWFEWLPDGSISFAENPPKKYEDIVNVHFYGDAFPSLWLALRDVVLFWVERGVKIFRVDNPHTKPFPFWEWLIRDVQARDPDVIFLAEAFTRPKIMEQLAQDRLHAELLLLHLAQHQAGADRLSDRADAWTARLTSCARTSSSTRPTSTRTTCRRAAAPASACASCWQRASAATTASTAALSCARRRRSPARRSTLNSEKYQLKAWNWNDPANIRDDITRMNALRRASPALQQFANVEFYNAWNDNILYYGKTTPDLGDFLLFAVNLDPHNPQGAHFEVPLWEFGLADDASIEAEDLVSGQRFTWTGKVQHMLLDPGERPYMIWRLYRPGGRAMSSITLRQTVQERTETLHPELTKTTAPVERGDREWYRDAIIYQLHIKAFCRLQRRRHRRLRRAVGAARLRAGSRRHRHLAAAVLSLAPAR